MIIISAILAAAVVLLLLYTIRLQRNHSEIGAQLSASQVECATLRERIKATEARLAASEEAAANQSKRDEERFRNLSAQMLAQSQKTLRDDNQERISSLLKPLEENLRNFNRAIDEKYQTEARERFALTGKIDELRKLNEMLGDEARQLSEALRGDSKVQGDWGEMILETLLAKAGFKEGEHYFLQETRDSAGNIMKTEDGRMLRPDVVVKFPPNNCVVIDSKTSLTAYVNWINATDEKSREAAGKAHVASVRKHIAELDSKAYQDHVGGDAKLDFVMMFIPNEGAYLAAMQLEPNLWQEAYDKRVLIISPTHLFSVLKLVEQMWRHDAQNKFAQQIANEAGAMYDKFAGVVDQMLEVQKRINASATVCDDVIKRLHTGNGNLVRRAEKLKELGAKASKQLKLADEDDEQ
jgi:DNA recombination protein RmuC